MLVIKNAKIYTSANVVIEKGDILLDNGKIVKVDKYIQAGDDVEVIEATGLTAIPGIIDAHTHAGCLESLTGNDHDANEISSPINLELDIYHSIDPTSKDFDNARKNGVTTVMVLPGSATILGGMCCILKCRKRTMGQMCFVRKSAFKGSLGLGPTTLFGKRGIAPVTMMGQIQIIRDTFYQAMDYRRNKEQAGSDTTNMPPFDQGMENLCKVLNKEIPLRVHVESHNIVNVIRIAEEFDIPFVLDHAFGLSHFIDEVVNAKGLVGVVVGPTFYPSFPGIAQETSVVPALELSKKGVCTAVMTDYFIGTNFGTLLLQAGEMARAGGDIETILNMLTINPAKILGIDDKVGSIEVEKDGDIVLFDGVPLVGAGAKVKYTFVDGEIVYKSGPGMQI